MARAIDEARDRGYVLGYRDTRELLLAIDHVVTTAPRFNESSMVVCPINALLDWPICMPSGYALFRDRRMNDALKAVRIPAVEVHMSDIQKREEFRHLSVTAPACIAQIRGHGFESYTMAIDMLSKLEPTEQ